MSRDAGYHIVQKRTVGISRRAFAKFISKQAVLQITRDALPTLNSRGGRWRDEATSRLIWWKQKEKT